MQIIYKTKIYLIYNIILALWLKRKWDNFNGSVRSKSEMYTTACKIHFMTKLYVGKGLVLEIVPGKQNNNNEVEG
jgi:hypothetical protein